MCVGFSIIILRSSTLQYAPNEAVWLNCEGYKSCLHWCHNRHLCCWLVCVHCFRDKHFCFKSQQCLKNSAPLFSASKSCICNHVRSVSVSVKTGNFCFQHNHNTRQSWGRASHNCLNITVQKIHIFIPHQTWILAQTIIVLSLTKVVASWQTPHQWPPSFMTTPDSFPWWSFLRGSTVIVFQCPVNHQGNISWEPITNRWPITNKRSSLYS